MSAFAAMAETIPSGGSDLFDSRKAMSALPGKLLRRADVEATGLDIRHNVIRHAIRVKTLRRPDRDYRMQLRIPIEKPVSRGETVLLSFWARGVEGTDEARETRLRVYFQQTREPWLKAINRSLTLPREWTHYCFPFRIPRGNYKAGEAGVYMAVGYDPQTIQVGDIRAVNYGKDRDPDTLPKTIAPMTYKGREADAEWRKAALARIEKHRKGDLTVTVKIDGKPAAGAKVAIRMKRHAYKFGSAVTAGGIAKQDKDGERYRQIIEQQFNKVVFENDLKYGPWLLGKKRKHNYYNHDYLFPAFKWLAERGILIRGHTLCWGPVRKERDFWRGLFIDNKPDEARKILFEHIAEKLEAVKKHVPEWDALNHPVAGFGDKGHRLDRIYGREIYRDVIQLARRVQPDMNVYINEGQIMPGRGDRIDEYIDLAKWLKKNDAAPDGIGFMCHFGEASLTPPAEIYERLEKFAALGCELQATEFDINILDPECQADYMRDFLTTWFSHPKTVGIIMWGFWEGRHWRPDAALYARDWTERPVGRAWREMLFRTWWTNEAGKTDEKGQFSVRGFLGDYEVEVGHGGREAMREVSLGSPGAVTTVEFGAVK